MRFRWARHGRRRWSSSRWPQSGTTSTWTSSSPMLVAAASRLMACELRRVLSAPPPRDVCLCTRWLFGRVLGTGLGRCWVGHLCGSGEQYMTTCHVAEDTCQGVVVVYACCDALHGRPGHHACCCACSIRLWLRIDHGMHEKSVRTYCVPTPPS